MFAKRNEAALLAAAMDRRPIEALNEHERVARELHEMVKRIDGVRARVPKRRIGDAARHVATAIEQGVTPRLDEHGIEFPEMRDLLQAIAVGEELVEFDTFSPAQSDYPDVGRTLPERKLTDADRAGVKLAQLFLAAADRPSNERARAVFTVLDGHEKGERSDFKEAVAKMLLRQGVVPNEVSRAGKHWMVTATSELADDISGVDNLVRLVGALQDPMSAAGKIEAHLDGKENFTLSDEFRRVLGGKASDPRSIALGDGGEPSPAALLAATYMGPHNRDIVHATVTGKRKQWVVDDVYKLLRAAGMTQPHDFMRGVFDEDRFTPDEILHITGALMAREAKALAHVYQNTKPYAEMVGSTYTPKNLDEMVDEEVAVDGILARAPIEGGIAPNSIELAGDLGSGSSLVGGMLLAPWAKTVELVEPGDDNVAHLRQQLDDLKDFFARLDENPDYVSEDPRQAATVKRWMQVENTLVEQGGEPGGEQYRGALRQLVEKAVVRHCPMEAIEDARYGMTTALYSKLSTSLTKRNLRQRQLASARTAKPGALCMESEMGDSLGWPDYAPEATARDGILRNRKENPSKLGALAVNSDQYAAGYTAIGLNPDITVVHDARRAMRDGYNKEFAAVTAIPENWGAYRPVPAKTPALEVVETHRGGVRVA